MMKLMFLVFTFMGTAFANAGFSDNISEMSRQLCEAEMTTRRGRVIDSYYGNNCRRALRKCNSELRRRQNRGRNPYATCEISRNSRRGQRNWVVVDEVHFYNNSTSRAIRMCNNAKDRDNRCFQRNYFCGECSTVSHSDHSSYLVYSPKRKARRRTYIDTYHFYHRKTAVARQKCENKRNRMRECSQTRRYECTPCSVESHTDHSQFELYRID